MSYILDALRRAQAERERGRLPGLQTQTAPAAPLPGAADAGRLGRRGPAVAALLLAVGLAGGGWWWWRHAGTAVPPAPSAVVPRPPPATTSTATAPDAVPAAAETAPRTPLPVVVSAPPPPAPPAPPVPPPPTPLAALPPELRRELPPLDIGGSVWSESPASRFVIINGQLVHEGQTAAPGVVVERIAQRSAVLRWRERRIELPL